MNRRSTPLPTLPEILTMYFHTAPSRRSRALAAAVAVLALLAFAPPPAAAANTKHGTRHARPRARPAKPAAAPAAPAKPLRTTAEILRDAPESAWRSVDPENLLLMSLPGGTVYIELAPRFAPHHVANIRTLVSQHYFDGLAVLRVQDNYVAQWGDPDAETPAKARPLGAAAATLAPEFSIPDQGLKIAALKDRDLWAPVTGFVDGFAVAANPRLHRAWLAHCYGVVGAGRDNAIDSGNGAELYAVIGQSPRALDLNITTVGRVLQGMDLLASLPRGGPNMGFYDKPEQLVRIDRVQRAAEIPQAQRPTVRVLRTESPVWPELVESRRNRRDAWYVHRADAIDLCNLTVPVNVEAAAASEAKAP